MWYRSKTFLTKTMPVWVTLLIVVILLGGFIAFVFSNKIEMDDDGPVSSATTFNTPTTPVIFSSYKNGTYSAIGKYDSPAGWDTLNVSITLADNIVTDVSVLPEVVVRDSKRWVEIFQGGISKVVVGKNIDELNLKQVSGASLTPKGFNDALEQIKEQAKI